VSNPVQKSKALICHGSPVRDRAISGEPRKGEIGMEPYRPSFSRRLASIRDFLGRLLAIFKQQTPEVRLQRMCPFCGLITPRAKRFCLECGKSLNTIPAERHDARPG